MLEVANPKKKLSRRQLLTWGSAALLGGLTTEALLEPNRLETIVKTVGIKDLPNAFEGFRIGLISDIHWGHAIDEVFVHRATSLLMATKPDLIAVTGDIYHGQGLTPSNAPSLKGVFDELTSPHGVFGVLGNHDHKLDTAFVKGQVEEHTSIQLIDNKGLAIRKGSDHIYIAGVGDLWEDKIDLKGALQDASATTPRILLSHNPDIAEHVAGDEISRVDLQLSGHSHGGQMVIPGIFNPYSRFSQYGSKFNRGFVEGKRHRVFVSKGIARLNHMRLFALPDVACITLTRTA